MAYVQYLLYSIKTKHIFSLFKMNTNDNKQEFISLKTNINSGFFKQQVSWLPQIDYDHIKTREKKMSKTSYN